MIFYVATGPHLYTVMSFLEAVSNLGQHGCTRNYKVIIDFCNTVSQVGPLSECSIAALVLVSARPRPYDKPRYDATVRRSFICSRPATAPRSSGS